MGQAGKKMRFWTNVGVTVGFLGFSLPWTMRKQIPMRFLKGMVAGTVGVFLFAPVRIPPSDLHATAVAAFGYSYGLFDLF